MPWGLKRFQESRQTHFITFTCYHRHPLLDNVSARRMFEEALESVRHSYRLCVYGYVVMPEHVHLLLSEPERSTVAQAIKALKQSVSRRLFGDAEAFWQKRYYDHNVRSYDSFVGKLRYIHRNPVKLGLCARPEDWEWSSFRHLCNRSRGRRADRIAMDSESARTCWIGAARCENPHSSNTGLSGPPVLTADEVIDFKMGYGAFEFGMMLKRLILGDDLETAVKFGNEVAKSRGAQHRWKIVGDAESYRLRLRP